MKIETIRDLIDAIYDEIKKRNNIVSVFSIPNSDTFNDELVKKFNLVPFTVSKLLKILTTSDLVLAFDIVVKDLKNKIKGTEGYVISDLGTVILLKDFYEKKFVEEFSVQFNKKIDPMKALKEFIPKMEEFNNTDVGKAANIVYNLLHFESKLKMEPQIYSKKSKAEKLDRLLENCEPLSFFINEAEDRKSKPRPMPKPSQADENDEQKKARSIDSTRYSDFLAYSDTQPLKKTLSVYGVEFYTRVCFREYQFHLIRQLIDENIIIKKHDLMNVKKLLKKVRANSDQDLKLQEFASEINNLERILNQKIKKFDG